MFAFSIIKYKHNVMQDSILRTEKKRLRILRNEDEGEERIRLEINENEDD